MGATPRGKDITIEFECQFRVDLPCNSDTKLGQWGWEQPARLRFLRGASPLTVSCPKQTVSISGARRGNKS